MRHLARPLSTAALFFLLGILTPVFWSPPASSSSSSSPPTPTIGERQPSSIAGCYRWRLEPPYPQRKRTADGTVLFRHVSPFLRWCPGVGYEAVTIRSPWRLPIR